MKRSSTIYLDHASGTNLLPDVKDRISDWLDSGMTNPSSIHQDGRRSAATLDEARTSIAEILGCNSSEILFTSGATEANNLAILGTAEALRNKGLHIITCATEHPSVLESYKALEKNGFQVTYLNVDKNGDVDPEEFRASITDDTILASFMWVNNETGLMHPVEELAQIAQKRGIRFHCDAVQAFGHIPIQMQNSEIDSLALSGHKLGAPAGIGVLYLRKGQAISRTSFGGSQEQNVRAGTQNHMGGVALATAIKYHAGHLDVNAKKYDELSIHIEKQLKVLPGIQINRFGKQYTPNILSCSFRHIDGEALFIRLDMQNIAVSNGAACSSGSQAPSHVLTALGLDENLAQASLRISMGIETTRHEIDDFCRELKQIVTSIYREAK
ncbi:MAG: cysteine desulfurase [FCB group bacterium]|nr:cysteine desulfurase [FCB group bacterium]MBL7028660.1 cysteine desulfurase [Candidatus Neomarinimicrobiota bacterium]MBL7121766.1 cysteine desulfurase [Candidatus Neomarinimicrobiota bacterium]